MAAFAYSELNEIVSMHHGPQVHGHLEAQAPSRPHPPPLSQMPWERVAQAAAEDREFAYQRLNLSDARRLRKQASRAALSIAYEPVNTRPRKLGSKHQFPRFTVVRDTGPLLHADLAPPEKPTSMALPRSPSQLVPLNTGYLRNPLYEIALQESRAATPSLPIPPAPTRRLGTHAAQRKF